MAKTSELDRVTAIVLRFMRRPILMLVAVYAIAITGMVLMPGQDAEGNPARMSFFHAFYFLTYTATTTGFGEIPYQFTDAQRLWAIVCLYMSVVAWIYAIGSIIRVVQNPHFQQAMAERSFARSVRRITEPFFIVCGFGDTGSLLVRGLNDAGCTAVVVDRDTERIKALALRDYRKTVPGLCADASVPKHLIDAGIRRPNCRAVVALTHDEDANVKIAIMARVLNPSVRVICLTTTLRREEYLEPIGGVEIMDPFEAFARWLGSALYAPLLHTLKHWFIGAPGASLDKPVSPPWGTWILCGYGRLGQRLHRALKAHGVDTVVIDPASEKTEDLEQKVIGHTDARTLREAGIEQAVGVVAATSSDPQNLGILLTARSLNSKICLVVRQNHHENKVAFNAANADLIMQPSLISARNILFMLVSPLIEPFLAHLREDDGTLLNEVTDRIKNRLGDKPPQLWTAKISDASAPAVTLLWNKRYTVTLGDIVRDPLQRERSVACVPLVLARDHTNVVMPEPSEPLKPQDEVLFCGTKNAQRQVDATLNNDYRLQYLVTGVQEPSGYVMNWLARRFSQRHAATAQG